MNMGRAGKIERYADSTRGIYTASGRRVRTKVWGRAGAEMRCAFHRK